MQANLVNGWRDRSHDPSSRSLPSHVANRMIARMSGLDMRDFGTTYKAYRRELLQNSQPRRVICRSTPPSAHVRSRQP